MIENEIIKTIMYKVWSKSVNFLKKKNKAFFVFFIITLYSIIGFILGHIIWRYVL